MMNSIISIAPIAAFMIAFFTITLVVMMKILRDAAVFGRKTSALLALAIAMVLIVGLWQFLGIGVTPQGIAMPTGGTGAAFKYLLFPYSLLGIAMLLQLAVFAGKMHRREASERPEPVRKAAKPAKPATKKEWQTLAKSRRGRPSKKETPVETKPADVNKAAETKRKQNETTETPQQG